MNSPQDITNRLSEKRKNCYLLSLDLVPGGKSTVTPDASASAPRSFVARLVKIVSFFLR